MTRTREEGSKKLQEQVQTAKAKHDTEIEALTKTLQDLDDELREMKAEAASLREGKASLEEELSESKAEGRKLQDSIREMEEVEGKLQGEKSDLETKLRSQELKTNAAREEAESLQRNLLKSQTELDQVKEERSRDRKEARDREAELTSTIQEVRDETATLRGKVRLEPKGHRTHSLLSLPSRTAVISLTPEEPASGCCRSRIFTSRHRCVSCSCVRPP